MPRATRIRAASITAVFAGELVLDALGKLAAHTGQHFRMGTGGRKVNWLRAALTASGLRAVQGGEGVALEDNHAVCLIEDIEERADGYELLTRVYPFGAGNGDNRLTLAETTRTAPTGYTLNAVTNELVNTAAETALGVRIERYLSWKEIGADLQQRYRHGERRRCAVRCRAARVADPGPGAESLQSAHRQM